MEWAHVLTVFAIVATNLGTVIALYFQLDRKLDEQRKETTQKLDEQRKETTAILLGIQQEINGIQQEMKDFHGRLCSIEERKNKYN